MTITLHEEMKAILKSTRRSLTSTEIAIAVNNGQRYVRGNGEPIRASQIRARAHRYPTLFKLDGRAISLRT